MVVNPMQSLATQSNFIALKSQLDQQILILVYKFKAAYNNNRALYYLFLPFQCHHWAVFDQGWTKGWVYIAIATQLKLILQHIVIAIFEVKLELGSPSMWSNTHSLLTHLTWMRWDCMTSPYLYIYPCRPMMPWHIAILQMPCRV